MNICWGNILLAAIIGIIGIAILLVAFDIGKMTRTLLVKRAMKQAKDHAISVRRAERREDAVQRIKEASLKSFPSPSSSKRRAYVEREPEKKKKTAADVTPDPLDYATAFTIAAALSSSSDTKSSSPFSDSEPYKKPFESGGGGDFGGGGASASWDSSPSSSSNNSFTCSSSDSWGSSDSGSSFSSSGDSGSSFSSSD